MRLLCCVHHLCKDCWVFFGQLGKDLAVNTDVRDLQHVDEPRVGKAKFVHGGVDLDRPQVAERALLGTAVAEGIHASLEHRWASKTNLTLTAPLEAFHAGEQIFTSFDVLSTSFYAWHIRSNYMEASLSGRDECWCQRRHLCACCAWCCRIRGN